MTEITTQEYEKLNEYLTDESYLFGFAPSKLDADAYHVLKKFESDFANKYQHVFRWYCHIDSFTYNDRCKFVKMHDKLPSAIECLFPSLDGQVRRFKITHAVFAWF